MKISIKSVILIVALMLTFTAMTTIKPVSAHSGTNIYADPAVVMRKDLHPGDTFTVDIWIENATLSHGVYGVTTIAFDLFWDQNYINVTGVTIGAGLASVPYIFIGALQWDYTTGKLNDLTVGTLVPTPPQLPHNLTVTLVVEVIHPGSSVIDITDMDCYDEYLQNFLSGECQYDCTVHLSEVLVHEAVWDTVSYYVVTESNSTITHFNFSQPAKMVYFNATGEDGTIGYVNITIPKSLLWVNTSKPDPVWQIIIDYGWHMNITEGNWLENSTHSFVYFTYNHSEQFIEVRGNEVVPEFPTLIIPFIILIATIIALVSVRKVYIPQRKRKYS